MKTYIVAVSGGVDSVVLLDMLAKKGEHELVVAHFDHGIRPESDADARFVWALAQCYGLPCEVRREELGAGASEELARARRYAFLRDIAADFSERGRYYFPVGTFDLFDDTIKQQIISDIEADFAEASKSVERLPRSAKKAVRMSVTYYKRLLSILNKTSSSELKKRRFRVPTAQKAGLLAKGILGL